MKYFILLASALFVAAGLFFTAGMAEAHGHGFHGMCGIMDQLTEEQRVDVHEMMDTMREDGASRCEVHAAMREMVEGYGIELPDFPPFGHGPGRFLDQLTEEQRADVHEMMDTMREDGALPCEIHEAVREMLEGYGLEPPGKFGRRHHGRHPRR